MCAPTTGLGLGKEYGTIVKRNMFALNPARDLPVAGPAAKPGPRFKLTGVTDILGDRLALLKIAFPAQPPEPPTEKCLILAEGQRDGDIEVVRVDVRAGVVILLDAGAEVTLSLEHDGARLPEATSPLPQRRK